MELNCKIAIEEVANGYIVRPLGEATEKIVSRHFSRVFPTLKEVLAFVSEHFRSTECPKCGGTCERDTAWLDWRVGHFARVTCQVCKLANVDGDLGEWIKLPGFDEQYNLDELTEKFRAKISAQHEQRREEAMRHCP